MYRSALGDFATREAEQFYLESLRRKSVEQPMRIAMELWQMAVEVACAGVRRDHPDWSEAQVRREVARRTMLLDGTTPPVGAID